MIRVSTNNIYLQSVNGINADQSAELATEAQLSSGKQINSPSDNPVGAAQASLLQSDITQLGQYTTNQNQATQLLNNASSTLTSVVNVMQSVRTTLVDAGNGTMSDANRSALAAQLQQDLNQLVGLANTSDTQGGYLFGGSVTSSPPFVQNGNTVTYSGDNLVQGLQISQTRTEQVKYAGNAVFMDIPTGNGTFTTAAASGNTGTGVISTGTVTAPASLTGDNYTITVLPGGTNYQVVDTTKNTTVVASTPLGTTPTTLSFDGMQMSLSGTPAAGDTFSVAPSGTQSVFATLSTAITALQTPSSSASAVAQRTAAVTAALGNTDQALTSLSTTQASMGAQLSELNTYGTVNSDRTLQDKTEMSSLVDLNYASAASQLSQQQTEYQAALQSYSAISKLSLFTYM
jgi:flagellar hook-associated protein 3 FlgL